MRSCRSCRRAKPCFGRSSFALILNLFFLARVQMSETPQYMYWFGGGLGGITLATVSSVIMWFAEKKIPTAKTIGRDLILGAILFFLLLQLLPESTMSLLTGILAAVAIQNEIVNDVASPILSGIDDIELRVGVPNF